MTTFGTTTVLNRKQEIILGTAIGVTSVYTPPFSSKTFGRYYDDAISALGRTTIQAGKTGVRAGAAVGKRAARSAMMKTILKTAGKTAFKAVPVVGWAVLVYDVGDFLIGDDPSFFGDLIDITHYLL